MPTTAADNKKQCTKDDFKDTPTSVLCRRLEEIFIILKFPCALGHKCPDGAEFDRGKGCYKVRNLSHWDPIAGDKWKALFKFNRKWWSKKTGFLSKKGCNLPRQLRSSICNGYACSYVPQEISKHLWNLDSDLYKLGREMRVISDVIKDRFWDSLRLLQEEKGKKE